MYSLSTNEYLDHLIAANEFKEPVLATRRKRQSKASSKEKRSFFFAEAAISLLSCSNSSEVAQIATAFLSNSVSESIVSLTVRSPASPQCMRLSVLPQCFLASVILALSGFKSTNIKLIATVHPQSIQHVTFTGLSREKSVSVVMEAQAPLCLLQASK